jgi:hypothetical protein
MTAAGTGDRGDVRALLADQTFWEPAGRIGVITQGEYANRLILLYSEPTPGHWTEVVSSLRDEGPLDAYILADEYAANVLEEYDVVWLARSNEEADLEDKVFGWRRSFKLPKETLIQRLVKLSRRSGSK